MSILTPLKRPVVQFEVGNKEHREIFVSFLNDRSWAKSPILFQLEDTYYDVVTMITEKMLHYYIKQDFNEGTVA